MLSRFDEVLLHRHTDLNAYSVRSLKKPTSIELKTFHIAHQQLLLTLRNLCIKEMKKFRNDFRSRFSLLNVGK